MFIFDESREFAVNSDNIPAMLIREVPRKKEDKDKPVMYEVRAVVVAGADKDGSALCLYSSKSRQDCVNWINGINNKMCKLREGKNGTK